MPSNSLTLADGQLAASAAVLLAADSSNAQKVSATFTNVGGQSETVVLTFKRQGGTARRLARAVLAANESLILTNLPMQGEDVLLGATTNATSVDYVVYGRGEGQFDIYSLDANGATKSGSAAIGSGDFTVSGDLTVSGGDIDAGGSGAPGTVDIFPATAAKGKLAVSVTDQATDSIVGLVIGAMAAARTITLPDPLGNADILTGKQAAVARTATAAGLTTGTIADAGKLQFVSVTAGADADSIIILPTPTPGTIVILHVGATGYELRSSTPASVAINGGTGANAESAIAADSTVIAICVSATAWKAFFLDADGDLAKIEVAAT